MHETGEPVAVHSLLFSVVFYVANQSCAVETVYSSSLIHSVKLVIKYLSCYASIKPHK